MVSSITLLRVHSGVPDGQRHFEVFHVAFLFFHSPQLRLCCRNNKTLRADGLLALMVSSFYFSISWAIWISWQMFFFFFHLLHPENERTWLDKSFSIIHNGPFPSYIQTPSERPAEYAPEHHKQRARSASPILKWVRKLLKHCLITNWDHPAQKGENFVWPADRQTDTPINLQLKVSLRETTASCLTFIISDYMYWSDWAWRTPVEKVQ